MIITFMYKIPNNHNIFYGKYVGYVTDAYEEGLDKELLTIIFPALKQYYDLKDESDIIVGIISYNRKDGIDYFSENEKNIFTMLYCKWSGQPEDVFMNGKLYKFLTPLK